MKYLLNVLFLFVFTLSVYAQVDNQASLQDYFQEKDIEPQKGEHGLFFQIDKKGKGQKPKDGDYVKIHYKGMLLDGTVFDESEKDNPYVFRLGHRLVIKGWDNGLQLFSEGSKGTLFVPSNQGYGDKGIADVIPKKANLIYEIELLEIMDDKQYDQYMRDQEKKERAAYEAKKKKQFLADKKIVQEYVMKNKMKKAKRTTSGMSYMLTKKGKGETAKKGDYIEVHYEGKLTDGTVFDSSFEKKEPFKFTLGRGKAIEGWEEGLLNFKKGSEGWLIVPSQMAYGPREIREGKTHIPANSVLIFKIKVVDLKPKTEMAKRK